MQDIWAQTTPYMFAYSIWLKYYLNTLYHCHVLHVQCNINHVITGKRFYVHLPPGVNYVDSNPVKYLVK